MKAKLRGTTGLPFDVIEVSYNVYEKFTGKEAMPFCQYYMDEEGAIYEGSALDFNLDPPHPEATISGWVARDKSGYLVLHYKKPHRTLGGDKWYSALSQKPLPKDHFPSLTWQDEPIEVEITIKPKKI